MDEKVEGNDRSTENSEYTNSLQNLGDGTRDNPFIISDAEGLSGIRDNLSAFYKLSADIDLNGVEFIPLGKSSAYFTGGLDGDGHTIKNLEQKATYDVGILGYAKDSLCYSDCCCPPPDFH